MSQNRSYGSAIVIYVAVGSVLAALLLIVILDPTLQLLVWSGAIAICAAAFFAFWAKRQPILDRYLRFPILVRGMLAGSLVWLFCFLSFCTIKTGWIPVPSFMYFGLFASICSVLAFPLAMGGWFFVWGDNGPPDPIFQHFILNILCGVTLCAALGGLLFSLSDRIRNSCTTGT